MTQGPGTYLNLVATGNILPMSFVKLDPSQPEACIQCAGVAGETSIGIAGTWTRYAGGTPANDNETAQGGNEAILGEFPKVASVGCVVPLICGATGTWVSGNKLKADALGYGTPCTTNADVAGAIALEPASPGVHGRVLVIVSGDAGSVALFEGALEAQKKEFEEDEKARKENEAEVRETLKAKLRPTEEYAEKAAKEQREKEAKQAEEAAKEEQKRLKESEKEAEKTHKEKPAQQPAQPQHATHK